MPALKADVSVQAQMVLMASQLEASERAHSAGSVATEGLSLSRLLELPVGICGPLDVVQLKGKGRGVLAVQPLLPGQLLLATPPLAIVQACKAASDVELPPPTAGDLVQLLAASRLTPRQSQLLAALYSGEDDSNSGSSDAKCESGESRSAGGSRGDSGPRQMRVQQLLQLSAAADGLRLQWGAGSGAAASTGWRTAAQLALPATVRGLRLPDGRVQVLAPTNGSSLAADGGGSRQQERRRSVTGAVVYNCYGEPARDEALEQLLARRRGAAGGGGGHGDGGGGVDAGGGFVGLWADYAMLNHSCCPNTINWVGGPHDHMAVIATAPIAAGQEVSVCYLGRELLAPRSVRTAALQRSHNFTCACRRCEHERRLGSALEAALQHVYDSVNVEWGPRLGALAEEVQDAAEALRELRRQQAQAQALTGQGRQGQASRGLFGALFGAVGGGGVVAAAATMREPVERARAALSSLSDELAALDQQVAATLSDVEMAASQAAAGNAAAATTAAEAGWWVRASLYDAYELRASIAEVLADTARAAASTTASAPGDTAGAVQQAHAALVVAITACLQIVAAVAPGSSLHVRLACQLESQQESQQHHQQGLQALVEAIAARYGGSVGRGTSRRGQHWQTAAVARGPRTPGALGVDDMACMVAHAARSMHAH